jgi:ribonuclease HI
VGVGKRLTGTLGYSGRLESIVLPERPVALDVAVVMVSQVEAIEEAGRTRQGLTIFTDGARAGNGAAGYAVVWKSRQQWVGIKSHMAYNQEAFDAECAALARALEVAVRRRITPGRVTIFTDAQAAIRRMGSDEPGPGQKYAIEARRWITALRQSRPEIVIEIRWCPAHKGVEGNEKADEWAKLAAEEPDFRGVEWLGRADQYGRRPMPPLRSLANLKREISEKKWTEAHHWVEEWIRKNKYTMPKELRPCRIVDRSAK